MKHTLDANILIALSRNYPRDIFPSIWFKMEAAISAGAVCICETIQEEISRGGDDLEQWSKSQGGFICPTSEAEVAIVAQIAQSHPDWVQGQRNAGDPFLIAHAKTEKSQIVTDEKRKGSNTPDRNQRIPNIADEHNVQCIKFFDFVRFNGWSF